MLAYEFYFIKHKLDQNRVRDVEHIDVKVFKNLDDGKMLGSASGEIYSTLSEEEIKEEIDKLIARAENVKNPFYELNKPEDFEMNQGSDVDVSKIAENFVVAMKSLPETETEYINSYEIFAEKNIRRFVNSEGIDITFEYPSSMVEVVVNAKDGEHEIELYRMYKSGTCDSENLKKDISVVLKYGKDKLIAKPTPKLGKAAVVFPTSDAVQIYSWFVEKCNAGFIYSKYSDWEIGKDVAPKAKGDKVTLKAVKNLPNSSKNFDVTGGTKSADEIRTGKYLEIVIFSDFAVDSISGDIAGEIRLGYYHDGDKVTPVSGGSISGCMENFINEMYMSKEKRQYDNFNIPALTRLENVSVTGVE